MIASTSGDGRELVTLVDELLCRGHDVRLRVTGRSMSPWLEDGAVVTLRRVGASTLAPGDIVLFLTRAGYPVLHRLIRRERCADGTPWLLVKGDACAAPDERITSDRVLAKVVAASGPGRRVRTHHAVPDGFFRPALRLLLAMISYRSPRLFRLLSHRVVPRWRRLRAGRALN